MREVKTTRKLQHPAYSEFINYLEENNIKTQEVADVIGKKAATVTKNNKGYTDYSYDEVMKICEHFKISKDLFETYSMYDSAAEFEILLRSIFKNAYIKQNGHEPINLEEEYQAKMKRMDAKKEEWKKQEQEAFFEKKMKEKEARDEKEKNASDEYKLIGKQLWPCEIMGLIREIQVIDGKQDISILMVKAYVAGTIAGVNKEREKKVIASVNKEREKKVIAVGEETVDELFSQEEIDLIHLYRSTNEEDKEELLFYARNKARRADRHKAISLFPKKV